MKSFIFFLCIFYSFSLNANAFPNRETTLSDSSHKQHTEVVKSKMKMMPHRESQKRDAAAYENVIKETGTATKDEQANYLGTIETSVELGLEFPLNFGVHGKFHLHENVYVRSGFGFTPQFLVGTFTRIAPGLGYLDRQEASLIGETIQNSFFGSLRLGWLPYTRKVGGPYMELGLIGFAWARGETSGTALNGAIGTELNVAGDNLYSVKSNVLSGAFHIGYQIPIEKHIHFNLELGILKIIYVNIRDTKKSRFPWLPKEHHKKFQDFLKNKGWIFPTLSGWIGFSF